jgi:DNA-binding NarL/FixJ family response regulator
MGMRREKKEILSQLEIAVRHLHDSLSLAYEINRRYDKARAKLKKANRKGPAHDPHNFDELSASRREVRILRMASEGLMHEIARQQRQVGNI